MNEIRFEVGDCIYQNTLSELDDIKDWIVEGELEASIKEGALQLESKLDSEIHGDRAHWLLWCPEDFPDDIMIQWEFTPIKEPGLCMFFFSAMGENNKDLFDSTLTKRTGYYPEYHSGDIDALHLSYFRRRYPDERGFQTCNLRKSHGFHLVATGADPLPSPDDANGPYFLKLIKYQEYVQFFINDLLVLSWKDEENVGPILTGGKIGFRQMAPMIACYSNISVHKLIGNR